MQTELSQFTAIIGIDWADKKHDVCVHRGTFSQAGCTDRSICRLGSMRESWVAGIGLDPASYGTHSLRRTKATLIYRRTKNLRAVQLLLGHAKLDSTVRYLGIEIDDALEMSEQIDV